MHSKLFRSASLAFSFGASCCLAALPASAQFLPVPPPEVNSSEEILDYFAAIHNNTWLQHTPTECDTPQQPNVSDTEFVESLLSMAAAQIDQIEDAEYKNDVLRALGTSYACLGQPENAIPWLTQAEAQLQEIDLPSFGQATRLVELAAVYGDLIDDADKMNALLAQALLQTNPNPETVNHFAFYTLAAIVRLQAKHGQYQSLRTLLNNIDSRQVSEALVAEASPWLNNVEPQAVTPSAEQAAIAALFSDFDIAALAALQNAQENSATDTSSTLREIEPTAAHTYRDQLWAMRLELPALITTPAAFIAEQTAIIEQMENPLHQAMSYQLLGDMLSTKGQPSLALPMFETSLQQFQIFLGEDATDALRDFDITEEGFYANYAWVTAKAMIRAGDFDQGYQRIRTYMSESDAPVDKIIYMMRRLPYEVESATFSLPLEYRLALLAEAQTLVSQLADNDEQWEALIEIAKAYVSLGEVALAQQMSEAIADEFGQVALTAENWTSYRYHVRSHDYAEFLISIGEPAQAITLSEAIPNPEDYYDHLSNKLPAHLVAAGQESLAEDLRAALPTHRRQLYAGIGMVREYQALEQLDEALALTKQLLEEAQFVDLTAEIGAMSINGGHVYPEFLRMERIDRVGRVIQSYYSFSSISAEVLSQEAVRNIGIELAASIESDWLRSEVIEEELYLEDAISAFEQDAVLAVPDSLLLRRAIQSVTLNAFEVALRDAEQMRSPHVKSLALTHIATQYLANLPPTSNLLPPL
ncbi:MAG: hypothetical protein AAFY33_15835 [Cyanobacteria bacterium J06643_4]